MKNGIRLRPWHTKKMTLAEVSQHGVPHGTRGVGGVFATDMMSLPGQGVLKRESRVLKYRLFWACYFLAAFLIYTISLRGGDFFDRRSGR